MEHTKDEFVAVEEKIAEVFECQLRELSDLQLAIVGGGIGDVVPH